MLKLHKINRRCRTICFSPVCQSLCSHFHKQAGTIYGKTEKVRLEKYASITFPQSKLTFELHVVIMNMSTSFAYLHKYSNCYVSKTNVNKHSILFLFQSHKYVHSSYLGSIRTNSIHFKARVVTFFA